MAESAKVKRTDVFEPSIFPTKEAKEFNDLLKDTAEGFASVLTTQQAIIETRKGNVKTFEDIKKIDKAIRDSQKARALYNTAIKEQVTLEIKEEQLKQQKLRTAKAENSEKEKSAKATERLKKETEKLNSVYLQESKRLRELKNRVKELLVSEKELTAEDKKLIKETQLLDDKLKKIDKTIGDGHRTVGLYSEGIKEAIAGTRRFDGEIAHTLVQLKSLVKQFKENTEGTNKFGNALKLVGIGALIAGITGAVAAFNKLKTINQDVADGVEKLGIQFDATTGLLAQRAASSPITVFFTNLNLGFGAALEAAQAAGKAQKDFSTQLKETTKAANEYADALQASRKELRELSRDTEKLILDQEDFAEIARDTTISFEERNKALKRSQDLQIQIADKQVKSATIENNLANKAIAIEEAKGLKGKITNELLDKQLQAEQALEKAQDKRGDLVREFAQEERQFNVERASFEVDLILKKKQSANADKVILENRLKDERFQLEERIKFSNRLLEVNRKTTAEEIKLFKDNIDIKFDENELINEQDAISLQRRLEGLKLGTEATVLLAKIIKQAQENQIANNEELKKLEEERIERLETIAQIEREIADAEQQQQIKILEDANETKLEEYEKLNEDILNEEKVFNKKLEALRKQQFDDSITRENELTDKKLKQLDQRAIDEKNALEASEKDDEIRVAKIRKIDAKLAIDKENVLEEASKKNIELQDAETEELRKIEVRKTQIVVEQLQKVTQALSDEVDKKNDKRIEEADNEIEVREKNIDRQLQLAEEGQRNQAAFEIAQLNKAKLEKQQIEETAQRQKELLQLTDALFAAYNARLSEPGANPDTAAARALADVFLIKGISKGLAGFFFEGTEKVADDLKGNKVHSGRDGYQIRVDGEERILTGKQNALIGDMSNDQLAHLAQLHNMGALAQMNTYSSNDNAIMNLQSLSILNEIKKEIKNKPVQLWNVNEVGELMERNIKDDVVKTIIYKKPYKFH